MEVDLFGFSLSLTLLLLLVIFAFVVIFLAQDYWAHTYWKRRGVPHEPAYPIVANMPTFSKGLFEGYKDLQKKHGKIFGSYMIREPVLNVADPDMLRYILVKNFHSFYNRPRFVNMNEDMLLGLGALEDRRWQEVRNVMSPTFSAAKMKQMAPLVNNAIDHLVKHVGKMQDEKGFIECKELFGAFIIDTIGICAFGLDLDSQSNPNNPFVSHAKRGFQFDFGFLFLISSLFPPIGKILTKLGLCTFVPVDVMTFFRDVTMKAVALRKTTAPDAKSKRVDFLQLMLDAQDTSAMDDKDVEGDDDIHSTRGHGDEANNHPRISTKNVKLTDEELFAQAVTFFLAGYETTTTLLSFIFYALATNPKVQKKLIFETDKVTPSRDSVGYTSVASMPYLDQVVCETLRMFPPAVIGNRTCTETFEYNGLVIEKGLQVFLAIGALHYNPEYWPEPETFNPDRFNKSEKETRHPFAYLPFGGGPRSCVGMRFALMETKMAVVRLLQNYRFETCPQTEIPPTFGLGGVLSPPNGVTLRAIPRHDAVA